MDYQAIEAKVTAFLTEELEIEENLITPDARLKEDLGIDSLEVVDVVVYVEKDLGFKMKPEDFKTIKTFREFCDFIAARV